MIITIENPTAEAAYAARQALPEAEIVRLKAMFLETNDTTGQSEEIAWRAASAQAATRFFEDEDARS